MMIKNIIIAAAIVLLVTGVGVGGVKVYSAVRGIRNNNPLNIERGSDQWDGMAPVQSDSRFLVFVDAVYGIRAAARILSNYAKRGVTTVEQIVSTWAPPNENDTEAYIRYVTEKTGFDRKRVVSKATGDYVPLLAAMIKMENGINPYSNETIAKGVSLS